MWQISDLKWFCYNEAVQTHWAGLVLCWIAAWTSHIFVSACCLRLIRANRTSRARMLFRVCLPFLCPRSLTEVHLEEIPDGCMNVHMCVCVCGFSLVCLGYNEELINRVLPLVLWAGGRSSQVEPSPTHTHDGRSPHTVVEPVWPGSESTQGGQQHVWTTAQAKREKVAVYDGALQFSRTNFRFGFCTGIQNQLALLTSLALFKLEENAG